MTELPMPHPLDADNLARKGDKIFQENVSRYVLGTPEMGRFLLEILANHWPTPTLEATYFANLRAMLTRLHRRTEPGRIVLGLGPGRCGSTTLTELVSSVPQSLATHENPPLVNWSPAPEQVAFHMQRLALLRHYFAAVFDAAHWWLNAAEQVMNAFPGTRLIGLRREMVDNVESFMRIKGRGTGSLNHWVPPGDGPWKHTHWDLAYPTYRVLMPPETSPVAFKRALISRYVTEYNAALEGMALRWPNEVMLVRTETLNDAAVQESIFGFVGVGMGKVGPVQLNQNTVKDGAMRYVA